MVRNPPENCLYRCSPNFPQHSLLPCLGHELPIFSMDPGDRPNILASVQHLVQFAVPKHIQVLVGHEHLERVDTLLPHQGLHFCFHLESRMQRQCHVSTEGQEADWQTLAQGGGEVALSPHDHPQPCSISLSSHSMGCCEVT